MTLTIGQGHGLDLSRSNHISFDSSRRGEYGGLALPKSNYMTIAEAASAAEHAEAGGGAVDCPPLTRLLGVVARNGKKRSKARKKIITKLFRYIFGSDQKWSLQGPKIPKCSKILPEPNNASENPHYLGNSNS